MISFCFVLYDAWGFSLVDRFVTTCIYQSTSKWVICSVQGWNNIADLNASICLVLLANDTYHIRHIHAKNDLWADANLMMKESSSGSCNSYVLVVKKK